MLFALIPRSCNMKRLGVFLLFPRWDPDPLQGLALLQHRRYPVVLTPGLRERHFESKVSPNTQTTRSVVERTIHEASAPPFVTAGYR